MTRRGPLVVAIAAIVLAVVALVLSSGPSAQAGDRRPFEPYSVSVSWTLPESWDYDTHPVVGAAIFPQGLGESSLCGRWVQNDVYWIDSGADEQLLDALLAGGVLEWVKGKPADSSIYRSHTFTQTPACEPEPTPTPTEPPTTVEPTEPPTTVEPTEPPTTVEPTEPNPDIGTPTSSTRPHMAAPPVQDTPSPGGSDELAETGPLHLGVDVAALALLVLGAGVLTLRYRIEVRR